MLNVNEHWTSSDLGLVSYSYSYYRQVTVSNINQVLNEHHPPLGGD